VEDRRDVVQGIPKSVSSPGHGLDLVVQPFQGTVGDAQIDPGQDPVDGEFQFVRENKGFGRLAPESDLPTASAS